MDAIELLTSQHDELEDLFAQCEQESGPQKQAVFDRIADLFAVHSAIEEAHFYPNVNGEETHELLVESVKDHFAMKKALAELIEIGTEADDFDEKCAGFRRLVMRHARELEENRLFPRVMVLLGQSMLDAIGERMTETIVTLESEGAPRDQVFQELESPAPI
jgi:hypothetical protein